MVYLLAAVSMVFSAVSTNANQAQWQTDYGKALAATRQDDRPLLVVLDVPADSKSAVKNEQLDTKGEQGKLLRSYQLCHVDASTKYGKKVAEVFKAEKLPFAAVIDKTGSVVLCKKNGQLSDEQWKNVLTTYRKGESVAATQHTAAYRGGMFDNKDDSTTIVSPSYCPSCQLKAQQSF
ncbi:MAG: hypothetical protein MI725_05665 [Pirellulales bacterium]|nr:hypothetical protein [Pirellulales bacterium]